MDPNSITPNGKAAYICRKQTEERTEEVRQMGYSVIEIWECEIDRELKKDEKMRDFFNDLNTKGKIIPRDGLYGGITMAFKMMEKSDEEHELAVFDVNSLYPYINYTGPYPLGHPKVLHPHNKKVRWNQNNVKNNEKAIRDEILWTEGGETTLVCGIVKVRVLPPRGLYFPILPLRIPGNIDQNKKQTQKLLFPLCSRCATIFNKAENMLNNKIFEEWNCPHTDSQRKFTVQTTTAELCEALKRGYTVDRFYRAWHYSDWTNDYNNPFRFPLIYNFRLNLNLENMLKQQLKSRQKPLVSHIQQKKNASVGFNATKTSWISK
jgi:hypothetical protein